MNWHIDFSADSVKFLQRNNLENDIIVEKIKLALRKFQGENINVEIKKLSGTWKGFYKIRAGKLRILAEFQFEYNRVYIEKVDWRGNVYKK